MNLQEQGYRYPPPGERKKDILLDSSSLILLYKSGLLAEVCYYYVPYIAEAVLQEISLLGKPGADTFTQLLSEGVIKTLRKLLKSSLSSGPGRDTLQSMGKGESETLSHALQGRGAFVVLDDRKAIQFCSQQDLPFVNTLLLPKVLYLSGCMNRERFLAYSETVRTLGHYSTDICNRAAAFGKDTLEQFFP